MIGKDYTLVASGQLDEKRFENLVTSGQLDGKLVDNLVTSGQLDGEKAMGRLEFLVGLAM